MSGLWGRQLAGFWLNVTEEGAAAQAGEEVPVVLLAGELVFSAIEPSLRRYGQAWGGKEER